MSRVETIGRATLYLGKPNGPARKNPLKGVVSCRGCDWTWKPYSGRSNEPCPQCQRVRRVTVRNYEARKNVAAISDFRKANPGYSSEWERRYRRRAVMLVGRGAVACVQCGCDRPEMLEINHINGGGGLELKGSGHKMYRDIARMIRPVDDLNLLCRPCNAVHYLELKFGPLPFKIMWEA